MSTYTTSHLSHSLTSLNTLLILLDCTCSSGSTLPLLVASATKHAAPSSPSHPLSHAFTSMLSLSIAANDGVLHHGPPTQSALLLIPSFISILSSLVISYYFYISFYGYDNKENCEMLSSDAGKINKRTGSCTIVSC